MQHYILNLQFVWHHQHAASISLISLRLWHMTTRWLYCVECPQYSIRFKVRAVTSFTVFCHLGMLPFWLSPFWFSLFWPYSDVMRPRPLRPSALWHGVSCHSSQRIWRGFLYGAYRPGEWLWIDSNGKNYFGSEFLAICNHFGVGVVDGDLKSQDVKHL